MTTRLPALLFTFVSILLAGCGGSTTMTDLGPPPAFVTTDYVFATLARSGTVSDSGYVGRGTDLAIGDSDQDESARGFYTFDLSRVDPQKLVEATLITDQFNQVGAPFVDLGPDVVAESVDIESALDAADFSAPGTPRGTLSRDGSRVRLDVTAAIKDLGFRSRSLTIRLRFPTPTDGNGDNDFINLTDPDNRAGSANGRPYLLVRARR